MSYSIQDHDSRIDQLERKVNFILRTVPVMLRQQSLVDPRGYTVKQYSLLDVYRELQATQSELVPVEGEVIKDGESDSVTDTDK